MRDDLRDVVAGVIAADRGLGVTDWLSDADVILDAIAAHYSGADFVSPRDWSAWAVEDEEDYGSDEFHCVLAPLPQGGASDEPDGHDYVCVACGRTFATLRGLNRHERGCVQGGASDETR